MTPSAQDILDNITVSTASDLVPLWRALLRDEDFLGRTLWLAILDEGGRPLPVVVPIEDIPPSPAPASIEAFGSVLAHLVDHGTPVLLIARPGEATIERDDVSWARSLEPLAPRWPVHLATEDAAAGCLVRAIPV